MNDNLQSLNQPIRSRNDFAVDLQSTNNLQSAQGHRGKTVPQPVTSTTEIPSHLDRKLPDTPTSENILPHINVPAFEQEHRDSPKQWPSLSSPNSKEVESGQLRTNQSFNHSIEGPNELPADEIKPAMPQRSERRRSRDGFVLPLNMQPLESRHSDEIASPVSPIRSKTPNFSRPSAGSSPLTDLGSSNLPVHSQSTTEILPPHTTSDTTAIIEPAHSPEELSQVVPTLRTKTSAGKGGQHQSLRSAVKGIRGAGDALRGAVNEGIAHTMHDSTEEKKMRELRQQGIADWNRSGLNERAMGLRDKTYRREKRASLGHSDRVHGSEGLNGLGPVDEVDGLRD